MSYKKAIHFGAGNIGRGFIGALLSESGYHVVFVDVNQSIIHALNKQETYTIHILDSQQRTQEIKNFSGLLSHDPAVVQELSQVQVVTTAVGAPILKYIAPTIAAGIRLKNNSEYHDQPLQIIACENMVRASTLLKEEVYSHLDTETIDYAEQYIGFPNSSVDRIVPPFEGNLLDVGVEEFYEWIVEKDAFKGVIPDIKGMTLTDNLLAYIQRKLFTLNCGHAIAAYLGFHKGYSTIGESIDNPQIYQDVLSAMTQSGAALIKTYRFNEEDHKNYIYKIIQRFKNPYIKDEISRVGRDPIRKLGRNDRIIAPLMMCAQLDLSYDALFKGAAAALHYDSNEDQSALLLQALIREKGIDIALEEITGIKKDHPLHQKLQDAYHSFDIL